MNASAYVHQRTVLPVNPRTETETLGKKIRRLRLARTPRTTQEQVARAVGVGSLAYGKWERDEAVPQPNNLLALAGFFGVDPRELGHYLDDETPQWALDMEQRAIQRHEALIKAINDLKDVNPAWDAPA